jgi:cytidine deaminase
MSRNMDFSTLVEAAIAVRKNAHAPYSGYLVGAALIDDKGNVHIGCNVENASFPEGTCAESGAIAAMVASGGTRIAAIACVGGRDELEACTPCGGCRQRIHEFADADTRVVLMNADGSFFDGSVADLLPAGFRLEPQEEPDNA